MSASRKPYGLNGSPCASLISDLKKFPIFKDYDKSDCEGFYDNLIELRRKAIERAKQILNQAEQEEVVEHYEDPSSRVFVIVELFSKLSHSLTNELHRD